MKHIISFTESNSDINLPLRMPTSGPEQRLACEFAAYIASSLQRGKGGVAVFHEPRLETGFPDIVFAEFSFATYEHWARDRSALLPTDLKILHHLYQMQGADSADLKRQLGISGNALLMSIERLLDGRLIRRVAKQWEPYTLKRIFAVKRIIAFEAKMKNWRRALKQAELNKWFASESYVVSPVTKPSNRIVDLSKNLGVGIYSFNDSCAKQILRSSAANIPSCYASWMFNEWIGRYLHC